MRILYLAPRMPHPELDRENVRPYHQIRFLALRHDVDLVTFGGGGAEWDARRVLLAALVNEHRLRARDPLKPARGEFEGALAEALLPETPVDAAQADALLAEFRL